MTDPTEKPRAEHTPTPFRWAPTLRGNDKIAGLKIGDAYVLKANTYFPSGSSTIIEGYLWIDPARRDFITRACNAHDLLEKVVDAVNRAGCVCGYDHRPRGMMAHSANCRAIHTAARQANFVLAAARGDTEEKKS